MRPIPLLLTGFLLVLASFGSGCPTRGRAVASWVRPLPPNSDSLAAHLRVLLRGCVRMERPVQLAAHLLGADSTQASLPTEAECEAASQSCSLTLRHPMPLHGAYAACAVVAGQLRFYPDVCGHDETPRRQLFGR